jgi:hypothetical protein
LHIINLCVNNALVRACSLGMRAEVLDYGSPEYLALGLYLAWRGEGLPIAAPGVNAVTFPWWADWRQATMLAWTAIDAASCLPLHKRCCAYFANDASLRVTSERLATMW